MKKKERRGCLGTNDPFDGNSYGVCHETPAPCSSCHSFPRHLITHFHSASGMLLWWAPPLWAGNSLLCVLLTCAPQSTQQHSGVLQTPRLCLRDAGVCLLEFQLWPRLQFPRSLEMVPSQMHQTAWDTVSWKRDFSPISIHFCLEIPFRWQLCQVSVQRAWTNSNLGPQDWSPGPVIFGSKGLRDQFYTPNRETACRQKIWYTIITLHFLDPFN